MEGELKAQYESQSQAVRLELKQWENDWAKTHGGKKPSRADIKANEEIARKYKQYQRYRDIIDGKLQPTEVDDGTKKRKVMPPPAVTPMKRTKHTETPTTSRFQRDEEELGRTPQVSRKLFSPATVTSLGPTPQRDGRVLGLFDLLVEREIGTPSKEDMGRHGEVRGDMSSYLTVTPRKRAASSEETTPRLGRTPMSSSKRQMLDTFMTPLKKKDNNAGSKTPSSVSKLQLETPQFLKRHALPTVDENGNDPFDKPAPLRLPRKPLGRGLSEIVASLRKDEEDRLDDDLEALREAEGGEGALPPSTITKTREGDVLVEDSQPGRPLLGGFDDEGLYDSTDENAVKRDGNLPVFKKKGQKRTTRKVNIKPVWKGRPTDKEPTQRQIDNEEMVPETQVAGDHPLPDQGLEPGSDYEDELVAQARSTDAMKAGGKTTASAKEGTGKKIVRKVNELAHANFRRLKLRNHGAKGGPGHNSRFRRKR